jgi:hypothetical protein
VTFGHEGDAVEQKYLFILHIEQGPQAKVKFADNRLKVEESKEGEVFTEFEVFLHDRFHLKPVGVQHMLSHAPVEGPVLECNAEGQDSLAGLARIQGAFVDRFADAAGFEGLRLKPQGGYFDDALGCQQLGPEARQTGVSECPGNILRALHMSDGLPQAHKLLWRGEPLIWEPQSA